eukprot:COSAG06_NODE_34572_length_472_cov_4.683646_1_plen_105_part_10
MTPGKKKNYYKKNYYKKNYYKKNYYKKNYYKEVPAKKRFSASSAGPSKRRRGDTAAETALENEKQPIEADARMKGKPIGAGLELEQIFIKLLTGKVVTLPCELEK